MKCTSGQACCAVPATTLLPPGTPGGGARADQCPAAPPTDPGSFKQMNRRQLLGAAALTLPSLAGATLLGRTAQAATTTTVTPNPAPPVVGVQFHGTWDMY